MIKYNTDKARLLRKSQTNTEKILWGKLRNRKIFNAKFRRQHPIDRYVVDFYCEEYKLIIEVDGEIHNKKDNKEYDLIRQRTLESYGYRIIRFKNKEIDINIKKVIKEIENFIKSMN
jgi:very-short-patch-repair endonuclease